MSKVIPPHEPIGFTVLAKRLRGETRAIGFYRFRESRRAGGTAECRLQTAQSSSSKQSSPPSKALQHKNFQSVRPSFLVSRNNQTEMVLVSELDLCFLFF